MARSFDDLTPYVSQAFGLTTEQMEQACRPALGSDLPGVLALRAAVNKKTWWDDEAFVRWRYFGRRTSEGDIPLWVFEYEGKIVGACGLEPVVLSVDGQAHDAVRGMDIMVHPDLDGRGLGMFMNVALFRRFPTIIVTGSNSSSHQLLSRMYHHTLDLVFWKNLIDSKELIERFTVGPLAGVLAVGANVLLGIRRRHARTPPPAGMDVQVVSRFDARVTDLALRLEQPGRIIVRRDADYLNWRFIENPRCQYTVFGAFVNGALTGYLVTRLNLARPNPRREGEIVDWLAAHSPGPASPLPALLSAAVDHLVAAGAGLVTCAAHGAEIEAAADSQGFRFRDGQRIPFFVRARSEPLHRRLASAPGWFLTRGDLDVE